MDNNNGFRLKKINVPTQYREASKILRQVYEEGKSLKSLVYENKHCRTDSMMGLLNKILSNKSLLENIIEKSEILVKETRLNPWLARILISELLIGRKTLNGCSKPVECVLSYHNDLLNIFNDFQNNDNDKTLKLNQQNNSSDIKVPRYVRINTIAWTLNEAHQQFEQDGWILQKNEFENYSDFLNAVKELSGSDYLIDYNIPELCIFPASSKRYWAKSHMTADSKVFLQDKASCLSSFILAPPPKSKVLDMCSAPGQKTVHLAALMKNRGKIYAVERDPKRHALLRDRVEQSQAKIIQTICGDALEIGDQEAPNVEYILLDPSCSGSGMYNRFNHEQEFDDGQNNKDRLFKLAGLQYKLLVHAMTSFPSVQRIVYSTCSINETENEEVVLGALKKCGNFKLLNALDFLDGKWETTGNKDFIDLGEKCLSAKTENDLTIGFFIAVFERCTEEEEFNQFYLAKNNRMNSKSQGENDAGHGDDKTPSENTGSEEKSKKKNKKRKRDKEAEEEPAPEVAAEIGKKKKKKWRNYEGN